MIAMSHTQEQNSVVRKIRVVKMRGQAHLTGSHPFRITDEGLRIYPRLLPPLADDPARHANQCDSWHRLISRVGPSPSTPATRSPHRSTVPACGRSPGRSSIIDRADSIAVRATVRTA